MKHARTLLLGAILAGWLGIAIVSHGQERPAPAAGDAPPAERVIFDFSKETDAGGWHIEDDVVMGGRSQGRFFISDEGHAVFTGDVSLENDGGFSSLQYYFDPIDVSAYRTTVIRLKGDGKRYQFLVEAERDARHYYVYEFETGTDWQTVEIPLAEMVPVYRGDRLDIPNFPGRTLAQVRFFIANKKAESFRLEIDKIWLR
ncbi:MAG: CIA30 family protein [Kiritimatiellae bacterium]|nr:CIA30 family protein [Kiritimatiellia bacterium]